MASLIVSSFRRVNHASLCFRQANSSSRRFSFFSRLFEVDAATPPEELNFWDGSKRNAIRSWDVTNDEEYGGESICKQGAAGGSILFSGEIIYDSTKEYAQTLRNGFCAITGFCDVHQNVRDCAGVEVVLKGTGLSNVKMNLKAFSFSESDLYQINLHLTPDNARFCYHIPFAKFSLTQGGRPADYQRDNDSLQIESLGFLVTEPMNEPFSLEIVSIRALPILDPRYTGQFELR